MGRMSALRLILFNWLFWWGANSSGGANCYGNELSPLLPWKPTISPLPLWDDVLQDPHFSNLNLSSETIEKLSKEHSSSLFKPSKDKKDNLSKQKKQYSDILVSYYSKLNQSKVFGPDDIKNLNQWKALLRIWSYHLFEHTENIKQSNLYRFHNFLFSFNETEGSLNALLNPKKRLLHLQVGSGRQRLLVFIHSLADLYSKDDVVRKNAAKILGQLGVHLNKKSFILKQLYLARMKSGFNSQGSKIRPTNPDYRNHLKAVSDLCGTFSKEKNDSILHSALSTWTSSDDFNRSWFQPPMNMSCYEDTYTYQVVRERQAVELVKRGSHKRAWDLYRSIEKHIPDPNLKLKIQKRIIFVAKSIYERTGSAQILHSEYIRAIEKPLPGQELSQFQKDLFHLTMDELNIGLNTNKKVTDIESLALNYLNLSSVSDEKMKSEVQWTLARLYEKNKMFQNALQLYLKISTSVDKKIRKAAFDESIRVWSNLQSWSFDSPWNKQTTSLKIDTSLFQQLLEENLVLTSNKLNKWSLIKNLGVVYILGGKSEKSVELWLPYWKNEAFKKDRADTIGFVAYYLNKSKNYPLLEKVLMEAHWKEEVPVYHTRPLDAKKMLKESIWNQAYEFYQQKKFRESVGKIDTYLGVYGESQEDRSLLLLKGKSFLGFGEYKQADKSLSQILAFEGRPFQYEEELLYLLFHLYQGMGKFDKTLDMIEKILLKFPEGESIAKVKEIKKDLCDFERHKVCSENEKASNIQPSEPIFNKIVDAIKNKNSSLLKTFEKTLPVKELNGSKNQELLYLVWYGQLKNLMASRSERFLKSKKSGSELKEGYLSLKNVVKDYCAHAENSYCVAALADLFRFSKDLSRVKISSKDSFWKFIGEEKMWLNHEISGRTKVMPHSPWVTEKVWWSKDKQIMFVDGIYTGTGFVQIY